MDITKPDEDRGEIENPQPEPTTISRPEAPDIKAVENVAGVVKNTGESVTHTLNGTTGPTEGQGGSTLNQRITFLVQYFRRWSYAAGKVIMPDIIDIVSKIVNDRSVIDFFNGYKDFDNCKLLLENEFTEFESTLRSNDKMIRDQLAKWGLTPKTDGFFLDARWIDSTFAIAIKKFNQPQREQDNRPPDLFKEGQLKALRSTLSRFVDGDVEPIVTAINNGSFHLDSINSQLVDHRTSPATNFILENCKTKGFRNFPKREDYKGGLYELEKEVKFEKNPGIRFVGPTDDPQRLPKGVLLDSNFGYKKDGSKILPEHILIIDDHEDFGESVFDTATVQLLDSIKQNGGIDKKYKDENGEFQVMIKKVDADTIISSWILKNLHHPLLQTSEFRKILRSISICLDFKLGSTIMEYGVKARDYVYIIQGMLEQTIESIKQKKRERLEKEIADEEAKIASSGSTTSEKLEKLRGYLSWVHTTPLENDEQELVLSIMHQALPAIITKPFAFDDILQRAYRTERETYDQISQSYANGEVDMAVSMYDKDLLVISRAGGKPLPDFANRQGLYIFLRGNEQLNRELVYTKDGDSHDLSTNAENMKSLLKYDFKKLANRIKTAEQVYVSHLIGKKKKELTASVDPEKRKILEYELAQLNRHFQINKEGGVWKSRTQNLACSFSYLPEHDIMRIIVDWKKESIRKQKKSDETASLSTSTTVDNITAPETTELKVSKDRFNSLFDNYSYTPENFVALFEEDFGHIFDADVQTPQFDTLREHILQVLHQYEVYFSYNNLPAGVSPKLIRLALLLHDIGKPAAVAKGQKHLQHMETLPIFTSAFRSLGFSESEVALAGALIEEDPIGKYLLEEGSLDDCVATLRSQAAKASMNLREYYELSMMFYMCDSSSYTSKPKPGKSSPLDKLFLLDEENRVISIAPAKEQKVDDLIAGIETYSRLDEIPSIEGFEQYIEENKVKVQRQVERLTKGGLYRQLAHMKSMFAKNPRNANAVAWYVYNYMNNSMQDPAREPSLENIEACLADSALMEQAVQTVRKICEEENMDLQFNLMTLFFNSNPALYVATMKRMTFEIPEATSKAGTDAKIDRLLTNYPGKTLYLAHQLAARLESEIIPKMLDTHATDLSGLLKMIGSGGIKYAKQIGYNFADRKGDDFKLAGSLAVFTYMGAFFDDADIFIHIDSDYLDEQFEKNPDSMCYYSEDFVVKPRRTANYRTAAQRSSFREKFADVMKRPDAKHYLAYKIANSILQEVTSQGIDIQDLSSAQLENWFIRYLENNSSGNIAPVSRLGGRPEGRLNFSVPLDKLKIRIPDHSIHQFIRELKAKKQEAENSNNADVLRRIKYLTDFLANNLGLQSGLDLDTLESRLTPDIQKMTIKDILKEFIKSTVSTSAPAQAGVMQAFLDEFDDRVQVYDAEMRKAPVKLYYKSVLQQSDTEDVKNFSNLRFLVVPKKNECTVIAPLQTDSERQMFAYHLYKEYGINPEHIEIQPDRTVIKGWDGSLDLVKIMMNFIQMDNKEMSALRKEATEFFEELKLSKIIIAPELETLKDRIDEATLRKLTDKMGLIRDAMQPGQEKKLMGVKKGLLQQKFGLSDALIEEIINLLSQP